MNIIRAMLTAILALTAVSIAAYAMAPAFFTIVTDMNDLAADVGNTNLDSWRNMAAPMFRHGFWWVALMSIIGIILWLYMWASRREYYTAGGYYAG